MQLHSVVAVYHHSLSTLSSILFLLLFSLRRFVVVKKVGFCTVVLSVCRRCGAGWTLHRAELTSKFMDVVMFNGTGDTRVRCLLLQTSNGEGECHGGISISLRDPC